MDDCISHSDTITFRISVTDDILADFTDEEVGKILRYLFAEGVSDKVLGKGLRQGSRLGSRDLDTALKALEYSAVCHNPTLRTEHERNTNELNMSYERNTNELNMSYERNTNELNMSYDENATEKETNKETEDIPPTPPIEDKENNKEKEESFQPANAGLSESSNEDYDAVAVVNARARGGKNLALSIPTLIRQFNRCMARSNIPGITSISNRRRSYLLARIKEHGIIAVYRVIILASRSPFLNGGGSQGFTANFDWIFRPNNFPKILEGQYNDRQTIFIPQSGGGLYTDSAQHRRMQEYANVAAYWRQQAENDPNAMAGQEPPPGNVPY